MKIKKNQEGNRLTLAISGRLETATAPQLQEVIENGLSGIRSLTLDIKQLEYISSAGLRTLLAAKKKMHGAGGYMAVIGANEEVMEVFKITGFNEILDIK